jgi:hypothetical protein
MATVMTEELRVRRRRPVEGKVIAGAAGAGLAAPLTGLVLWLLEEYALHAPVPGPLELFVLAVVPLVVAYVAAWSAPHTPRPDLLEPEPEPGPESLWARMMEAGKAAPPVFHIHPADPIVVTEQARGLPHPVSSPPEVEHVRSERERRRVTGEQGEPAESSATHVWPFQQDAPG